MGCNQSKVYEPDDFVSNFVPSKDEQDEGEPCLAATAATAAAVDTSTTTATATMAAQTILSATVDALNPRVVSQRVVRPLVDNTRGLVDNTRGFIDTGAHHLHNVFAAPMSFISGKAQSFPKTKEEEQFLGENLKKNYLFDAMSKLDLKSLIASFEKVEILFEDPTTLRHGVELIHEGDMVNQDTAYFYLLYRGKCSISIEGKVVGWANSGDSFGELALLYDCPRMATVTATVANHEWNDQQSTNFPSTVATFTASETTTTATPQPPPPSVVLFRVHQSNFRRILHQGGQTNNEAKLKLLEAVPFLKNVNEQQKNKLAAVMHPRIFQRGEYLITKDEPECSWFLLERGSVLATNMRKSVTDKEHTVVDQHSFVDDIIFGAGEWFGERAIMSGDPAFADVIAQSAGVAFVIDQPTFLEVLGRLDELVLRGLDQLRLKLIPVLAETTQSDPRILNYLASQVVDETYAAGTVLVKEGEPLFRDASLYLIRKGNIVINRSSMDDTETLGLDRFFGEDQMYEDTKDDEYVSPYTATVKDECVCGVLKLKVCRRVLDTHRMGMAQDIKDMDSWRAHGDKGNVTLEDLKLYRILGAGTFGQTWLVTRTGASDGKARPYALKVQSKFELCKTKQAAGVVREKNIMAQFHNPFVVNLVASFQDDTCVYMLMDLIQGGELHSVMHSSYSDKLSEQDAKFYIACIAEGLSYLHRLGFVFRDLKPENVMIDNHGFPIIIDFGFTKKIISKTFTMCGSPMYMSPEIILNCGHNWATDHWSLGIILFEMLVGYTPFFQPGMSKSELFRAILRAKIFPPENVSKALLKFLASLLKRDPAKRLGSLAGGENDILQHEWFSEIDMDLLFMKDIKPPFVPNIKYPLDVSNFDSWDHVEDKTKTAYPKLTPEQTSLFKDF